MYLAERAHWASHVQPSPTQSRGETNNNSNGMGDEQWQNPSATRSPLAILSGQALEGEKGRSPTTYFRDIEHGKIIDGWWRYGDIRQWHGRFYLL